MLNHFIIFILIINSCFGGWRDVLKDIKQKAKEKYQIRQKTTNFLGYDPSEYPGSNEHYRKLNKEKWDIYYECLLAQEKNLGIHRSASPVAIAALEGTSVKLDCAICLSPENMNDIHKVEWRSAMKGKSSLQPVEFDEHILVSPVDKALMMYNLKLEQTGQYMCSLGQSLTAPYFLTVVKSFESDIDEVHPKTAEHGPYPKEDFLLPQHNIRIHTEWGPWSPCSECGKIGKHHRYGFCVVQFQSGEDEQIRRARSITKKNLEILKTFPAGIPCSSHILPVDIKRFPDVKNRRDEIMIGFCQEKCKDESVYEVKDEHGKILEQANNSAGIYSMEQGMPQSEPHIEKTLEYRKAHSDITLSCPGNLNSDVPIQWQIGQKLIIPELVSKESNGRIFVGITDRLHIKRAMVSDSNIYSCWQHKELAGIVKLVVEKKLEFHFNHHVMMLAMTVILFTFFWVFTKAFFGRKYARIKD
ncbi:Ig-like V-type domain-containing protein FAM187A [Coccinella septempunctata]|uniref:Ig-like V-type domain-containing protein FAM187A n=1 Tax=Coccinella septempunctata TaxID=41139 RepID=UPI001D05DAD8|nr:Ig-like V-type domain-containing protein FAM187A [Coccinella septempunctata]